MEVFEGMPHFENNCNRVPRTVLLVDTSRNNQKLSKVLGLLNSQLKPEGLRIRTLSPIRRFGQGLPYSLHRPFSQGTILQEQSAQNRRRTKHNTYRPLDYHWVILSTSKPFNYFLARHDEIRYAFDPP